MRKPKQHTGWKWKTDPAHRKAMIDALADEIREKFNGTLSDVPRKFADSFAKWWAGVSYYGFGYGDGTDFGGIKQQVEWALDKQPINKLGRTHPQGLVTRTVYRTELQHRGIKVK